MLFTTKRQGGTALAVLILLVGAALLIRRALGLDWRLGFSGATPLQVLFGMAVILTSDGLIHGLLCRSRGESYRASYRHLASLFHGQGPLQIALAGLVAGLGEELFFRGGLLEGLISRGGLAPAPAVGVSALLFGALHRLPDPRLTLFAVWAVGQGLILGTLYVATGSLIVPVLVHGMHDMIGFSLFARERRLARLAENRESSTKPRQEAG